MNDDVLVIAESVSKKFCRSLRKSLMYGLHDLGSELRLLNRKCEELRSAEFWALEDISFELRRGECLGLIGPNGAGKSTLLKILNGLIKPDKGKVTIYGRVGALIELGAGFNPILTARENIFINGSVLGFSKDEIKERFDAIVEFSELEDFIDTPVQSFSSGMQVRLGFAIAAQLEPDVLLIDEVLAVGDVGFRSKCFNAINRIMKNSAVIFVSHNMPEVSRICSRVITLNHGGDTYLGNDVGQGISKYLGATGSIRSQLTLGNGRASINSMRFGVDEREVYEVSYREPLVGLLTFELDSEIESAVINISFLDESQQAVATASSRVAGFRLKNSGRPMTLKIDFGKVLLNDGVYGIEVAIHDKDMREVFQKKLDICKLKVCSSQIAHASCKIDAEWDIVSD